MKTETESNIQSAICEYLAAKRYFFWRSNNIPAFDWRSNQFRRLPKHTMRGLPDIIIIRQGRFIGLEVKRKGTKQSEHQVAFEKLCSEAGGAYHVVRSIEDVQAIGL